MTQQGKVIFSVVVLTYNQKDYIGQTLDSILGQEHDYTYEIVIGDDYSTDGTRDILLSYKEKHPDFITLILNEQNMGLVKNYFNVIRHCSGKYIMGCGGDDYWLPGKAATQIAFMEEHPDIGMCYGRVRILKNNKFRHGTGACHKDKAMWFKTDPVPALSASIRKELLEDYINEIQPENQKWIIEDYPIWLWLICNNKKVHYFKGYSGVYRILIGSVSNPASIKKRAELVKCIEEIKNYFLKRYDMDLLNYDLTNDELLKTIGLNVLLNDYADYTSNVRNLRIRNLKSLIIKLLGRNHVFFNAYRKYLMYRNKAFFKDG